MVCTPLLEDPRRKGGFCAPLRRYTPYTNNSWSNYQIRIHSQCFSLFVPHPLPLPCPYLPGEVAKLIVARSTIRSRENEQRFIVAMGASLQPAGSFSRQDVDLKEKWEETRRGIL